MPKQAGTRLVCPPDANDAKPILAALHQLQQQRHRKSQQAALAGGEALPVMFGLVWGCGWLLCGGGNRQILAHAGPATAVKSESVLVQHC